MPFRWRRLLLMILWSFGAEGIFHLDSIQTIPAPSSVLADSLFGYSISYQPTTTRLIISAPNMDIGKIFDCKIHNKECEEIKYVSKNVYYGKMWLGATVASNENFTMACAPRFVKKGYKTGTFGKCFATAPTDHILKPLGTISDNAKGNMTVYEDYMDSFGWSAEVARDGSVIVGGPFMEKGRTMLYSDINAEPKLLSVQGKQQFQLWYNFNFGYSVTSGNFMSADKNKILYAMSSTYGMFGVGALLVSNGQQTWGLKMPDVRNPHVGCMFGAALTSAAIGPGPQALLVGAPAYASHLAAEIDRGVVYIYIYDGKYKAILPRNAILGKEDGGRFGSAIVSLGDLNGDGRDEVAIAAPYEDSGAVYIFSGAHLLSSSDDNIKELQKIKPSGYKAFGLSLAVIQDYDDNGCNELAIGVPENNSVVVLSCMAKIIVIVNPLEPHITPEHPRSRRNDTYYVYKSCVNVIYPKKPARIEAEIEVKIQITHSTAKLDKSSSDVMTYPINIRDRSTSRFCTEVGIIIPTAINYDPMIQYLIRARQLNSPVDKKVFEPSRVLLSDLSQLEVMDVQWAADCGDDGCKPKFNFTIQTTIPNKYIIGSSASENVSVLATNTGDVAYDAYILVRVIGVQVLQFPHTCELLPVPDTFKCQPRSPVKKNTEWQSGSIELDMKSLKSNTKEIKFEVTLYPKTAGKDPKTKEAIAEITQELSLKLYPDPTPFILRGSTNIGNDVFMTSEELIENGKIFSHDYYIYNFGLTDWVNIQCDITMEKKFVDKFIVNIDASTYAQCTPTETKNGLYSTTCIVDELKKNQKFLIMLPVFIPSKTLDLKKLQSASVNVTIRSQLKLIYDKHQSVESVNTSLKLKSATVPIWIIIIAVLVGIIVICMIIYALHECGYLRRKNKRKLRELRRSVYRQSVRRSQISQKNHENRPGSTPDEENVDRPVTNKNNEDLKLPTDDIEKKDLKKEDKQEKQAIELPEGNEEYKIKKKDEIIRGLQKNLEMHRSNQFLGPPAKEKYNENDF